MTANEWKTFRLIFIFQHSANHALAGLHIPYQRVKYRIVCGRALRGECAEIGAASALSRRLGEIKSQ